jgi:hypothetical protein
MLGLAALCVCALVLSPARDAVSESAGAREAPGRGEIARAPQALEPYQQYLQVVGARGTASTPVEIEATVIAVHRTEVCPYRLEVCPIPPYPNDWGRVRIERVRSPASTPRSDAASRPSGAMAADRRQTTPPDPGSAPPHRSLEPLRAGREVEVQFLLTARPVVVRRVPSRDTGDDREATAVGLATPAPPTAFHPLPRTDGRYLFVIGTTAGPDRADIRLPGLAAGDRFRADASYDGVLRVRIYEPLPRPPPGAPP